MTKGKGVGGEWVGGETRHPFNSVFNRLMKEKRVTRDELAKSLNTSRSEVDEWLDQNRWTPSVFCKACEAVGVATEFGLDEFTRARVAEVCRFEWKTEPFSEFFEALMVERGLSCFELARRIGISRSTVGSWLNTNRWTRGIFRKACEAIEVARELGLADFGHAHVAERFVIEWKREEKNRAQKRGYGFSDEFEEIDRTLQTVRRKLTHVSTSLCELTSRMKHGHLVVVFSGTVMPLIYRTNHESSIVDSVLDALTNGALFCVIAPTEKYWKRLRTYYGFDSLEAPSDFDKQLQLFRERAYQVFQNRKMPEDQIRLYLYGRLQQIHVNSSPWFCPGFTFSLFAEFNDDETTFRAGMRVPEDAFGYWTAFPIKKNNRFETRLRKAALRHLRREFKNLERNLPKTDDAALRIKCLQDMLGVLGENEIEIDRIRQDWQCRVGSRTIESRIV